VLDGDAGEAAGEVELEEGLASLAGAALDPAEGVGGGAVHDLERRVARAEAHVELRAFLHRASRLGAAAAREPVGEAGGGGEQLEDPFDRGDDVVAEGGCEGPHGYHLRHRSTEATR